VSCFGSRLYRPQACTARNEVPLRDPQKTGLDGRSTDASCNVDVSIRVSLKGAGQGTLQGTAVTMVHGVTVSRHGALHSSEQLFTESTFVVGLKGGDCICLLVASLVCTAVHTCGVPGIITSLILHRSCRKPC